MWTLQRRSALVERVLTERPDAWLDAGEVRALLESYGVPVVQERVATDVDAAVAAAREVGYPVVVKTAAAGAHKTETGGVALDLRDDEHVRLAVERIGEPVARSELRAGRSGAPGRHRAGSAVRPARGLRARRRARRADRRRRLSGWRR